VALTPVQAIDAVNGVFGRHAGRRALHAKGTLCRGSFTATPAAAQLTIAAHMRGATIPATVRFSNGSGDPGHPDWAPEPRGLAIKLYLHDGSRTDIVAVSSPRFPVSTPDAFIELVLAQGAGEGDPTDDPSAAWPRQRQRVTAGTLEITELEVQRETGDDVLVFDPTRITAGIELSDDPVLQFRRAVCSESVARRTA
jgi:catalase